MDDPTVQWNQQRFDDIQNRLKPFLKKYEFKINDEIASIPCSGFTGANLKEHPGETVLSWYKGPTVIEYLDHLRSFERNASGPFRFPIIGRFNVRFFFFSSKMFNVNRCSFLFEGDGSQPLMSLGKSKRVNVPSVINVC